MRLFSRPVLLASVCSLLLVLLFFSWYSGGDPPLSAAEIHSFEERIHRFPDPARRFLQNIGLAEFMRSDDGRSFHVVNLFKLAEDSAASEGSVSGQTRIDEFGRAVFPLWLRHASHPVFSVEVAPAPASPPSADEWDFVSVVRYRSRRDFMEIIVSDGYQSALANRLAATDENLRIVSPGSEFPKPSAVVVLVCGLLLALAYLVESVALRKSHNHEVE